jgi:hypothetical protein
MHTNWLGRSFRFGLGVVALVALAGGAFVLDLGSARLVAEDTSCCTDSSQCGSGEFCMKNSACPDPGIHTRLCVTDTNGLN